MKIIAKTQYGVIAEMHNTEIARLLGYYGEYSGGKIPEIGAEVKVNEMYDQLYKIRALKSNIKEIEKRASELLESIRTKSPVIAPIVDAIEKVAPKDK